MTIDVGALIDAIPSHDRLFGLSVFGAGAGVVSFFKGFRTLKLKRLIENTPTSKVRSMAMGQVELKGKVVHEGDTCPLVSPFSGTPCLYYTYLIEEYRSDGKNSSWHTVESGASFDPFYFADDTGRVLVDPSGAEVDIPKVAVFESGSGRDPNDYIREFLQKESIAYEGWFGANKQMRFTERFLAPNDPLYLLGTAQKRASLAKSNATRGTEPAPVIIAQGSDDAMFYISMESEEACDRSKFWGVVTQVYGGATLTVACLGYVLFRLKLLQF